MSAQRLGNCAAAIQRGVLQSAGGSPERDGVLHLFPALPDRWNARFRLFAKGGFRVESECVDGIIGETVITSDLGSVLRVRNPYPAGMLVSVNGGTAEKHTQELLEMDTKKGDVVTLRPL